MTPIPYLFFKGTCEEAIRAYASIFGSPEPQIMRAREAPDDSMGGDPNAVMHAALRLGDGWLYASDYSQAERMAGASINVTMPDVAQGRRVFEALSEGGEVEMPFGPTFWDPGFGSLTDRWGTRWMISTEAGAGA
jgi:PhnB protein